MNQETIGRLKEPFSFKDVEWKIQVTTQDKTRGMAVAYIDSRAIQNRLDEAIGAFHWRNEFVPWQGNSQICGLSVYDNERGDWVTKKVKHPDKPHRIEVAKGIIRYEVQYYQFKLYPIKRIISKKAISENPMMWKPSEFFLTEQLISDEAAHNVIIRYFSQTIMMGDYYVLSKAVKMVKDKGYCSTKEERLIKILKLINRCRGVSKAATVYITDQKSANDFNRSLKELNQIGLNPITIPREWGINYIPNLLKEYRESIKLLD